MKDSFPLIWQKGLGTREQNQLGREDGKEGEEEKETETETERRDTKVIQIEKGEIKLSLLIDKIILYKENSLE
jgi:hypothetical protein